jgi:hypothetical protein
MMNMVDADIGGKPAQDARQVIVRTAVQPGIMKIPATSWAQNVSSKWCWI